MSHSSVGRQMDQLPKLISRTWQHRQGRLLILAVASLFLLAVWHTGSSVSCHISCSSWTNIYVSTMHLCSRFDTQCSEQKPSFPVLMKPKAALY